MAVWRPLHESAQPCSQASHPASHHWKVRLVLHGGKTSSPGRGHLVLGPHVQDNSYGPRTRDSWSEGTHGPPTSVYHIVATTIAAGFELSGTSLCMAAFVENSCADSFMQASKKTEVGVE